MSWTNNLDLPGDGPDASLVYMVRSKRLRYSRQHINQAILGHPEPTSLLALVEVAQMLGLAVKPARADVAALSDVPLPAIVHFGRGDGGFGVLEGVSLEGITLWDSVNGSRVMPRELFVENWSGVLVLVDRADESGPRERGYLGRRIIELLIGYMKKPALVGERGNRYLQMALLLLTSTLLCLSVATAPSSNRAGIALLMIVTIVGATTASLTVASTSDQGTSLKICRRGKLIDCEGVLTSRYSRLFGIPLSEIGLAFFGALILLLATAGLFPGGTSIAGAVGLAYTTTVPFSVALIGAQVKMRQFCTLCLVIHIVNFSGTAISLMLLPDVGVPHRGTLAGLLLLTLLFMLLLFLVIPYLVTASQIGSQLGAMRRIQASPFATLAALMSERPLGLKGRDCGVFLAGPATSSGDVHELVVFVHPGCSRCWAVMQELEPVAASTRVRIYLSVAAKNDAEDDHRLCSAVVAAGLSGGPDALFPAYKAAKEYLARPSARSGDEIATVVTALGAERPAESDIQKARRLVQAAADFAEAHTKGTPALFLNGRAVSAPPAHLAFLLSKHPDLLSPLVDGGAAVEVDVRGMES